MPDATPQCADCTHPESAGRVKKFDGGRNSLLCGECRQIIGTWTPGNDDAECVCRPAPEPGQSHSPTCVYQRRTREKTEDE
jgi:hypothetical protein